MFTCLTFPHPTWKLHMNSETSKWNWHMVQVKIPFGSGENSTWAWGETFTRTRWNLHLKQMKFTPEPDAIFTWTGDEILTRTRWNLHLNQMKFAPDPGEIFTWTGDEILTRTRWNLHLNQMKFPPEPGEIFTWTGYGFPERDICHVTCLVTVKISSELELWRWKFPQTRWNMHLNQMKFALEPGKIFTWTGDEIFTRTKWNLPLN